MLSLVQVGGAVKGGGYIYIALLSSSEVYMLFFTWEVSVPVRFQRVFFDIT
jgi:hypothetical protein